MRTRTAALLLLTAPSCVIGEPPGDASPPVNIRAVAQSGDPAPGLPVPASFAAFSRPVLRGNGRCGFLGVALADALDDERDRTFYGAWLWDGDRGLRCVYAEELPGRPAGAVSVGEDARLAMNDLGCMAILRPARAEPDPGDRRFRPRRDAVLTGPDGAERAVVTEGLPAAGCGPGWLMHDILSFKLDEDGRMLLTAHARHASEGLKLGIWLVEPDGTVRLVALSGRTAPGGRALRLGDAEFAGPGEVWFTATPEGSWSSQDLWMHRAGSLSRVWAGDQEIDAAGHRWRPQMFSMHCGIAAGRIAVNLQSAERAAHHSRPDLVGLWSSDGLGAVSPERLQPAPGIEPVAPVENAVPYAVGDAGDLVVGVRLAKGAPGVAGDNSNREVLYWVRPDADPVVILRAGDPAPGGPARSAFSPNLGYAGIGPSGRLVIRASLWPMDGEDKRNRVVAEGIWAWDTAGGLRPLVVTGVSLHGDHSQRIVHAIETGRDPASRLTPSGATVFAARFRDGSSGVYIASSP